MFYVFRENWSTHPILSRLVFRSDFDGDGTFCLEGFAPDELTQCKRIRIEASQDGGQTWISAGFSEEISYVGHLGAGWYVMASYHPYEELVASVERVHRPLVRAVISGDLST